MAHRVVLMARMEYFRSLLTIDMRDRKELFFTLDSLVVDPEVFHDILDYVYAFKINFTLKNLESICKASDFFCFQELLDKAKAYIKKNVIVEATEPLMNLAIGHSTEELKEECAKQLIQNSSSKVAKKLLIPTLSLKNLKLFINKLGDLSKEKEAFNYCIEWILHDQDSRKDKLSELLTAVQLVNLPKDFLRETVLTNQLVVDDKESLRLLATVLAENFEEKVYILGGKNGDLIESTIEYQFSPYPCESKPEMNLKLISFGCAVIGSKIYICGGEDDSDQISAELKVFDTDSKQWKTLKPMSCARKCFGMVALGKHVYVACGKNGERETSAEKYSVENGEWQEVAPMKHARKGLEMATVGGYIYAIGGIDINGEYLCVVERYDPMKNEWKEVESMHSTITSEFGCTVLNGRIYVSDGSQFLMYDPIGDDWTGLPDPEESCDGPQLATVNERIYSFGGRPFETDDDEGIATVWYFYPLLNKWIQIVDMNIPRSEHRVAVVRCSN